MDTKHYYKALGISENATDDEIKKAFKKLSLKYHPDRQQGKSEDEIKKAEEQFKIINEAYSVLSDTEKRHNYDATGDETYNPFNQFNPFNPWGGRETNPYASQKQAAKGRDIRMRVPLTVYDLYNGCHKKVKYQRYIRCVNCHGAGGFGQKRCQSCHGTGYFVRQSRQGGMFYTQTTTCPTCNGRGTDFDNKCPTCNGEQLVIQEKTIELEIPKFMDTSYCIEKKGDGNESTDINGENGDFYAEVFYKPEENYEIKNLDVYEHIKLPYYEILLGCEYTVHIPNGQKIKIYIPSCTKEGTSINVGKCGLESQFYGGIGNYYIIVHYDFPETLTAEDKKLLESIKVNAYKTLNNK